MLEQRPGYTIENLEKVVDMVIPPTQWCPYKTQGCTPLCLCPKCKIAFGKHMAEYSADDAE